MLHIYIYICIIYIYIYIYIIYIYIYVYMFARVFATRCTYGTRLRNGSIALEISTSRNLVLTVEYY